MTGINGRSGFVAGRAMRTWLALVSAIMLTYSLMAAAAPAGAGEEGPSAEKVTICHAAGRDGTTHYETLTIGYSAVYGPAGHFYEHGTPRAGHEQDYLGECVDDEPESNSASLTVVKLVRSTDQDVPQTRFPFVIAAAGETESFALLGGGSRTFDFEFDSDRLDVVVGEVTGDLADGFSFVSASCAIGDRVIPQGSRASVSLLDGADVTCTFLNRYDQVPQDAPSVKVVKDVQGDEGASTTEFDIDVGTRDRFVTMTFGHGGSHTFLPLAGTGNFGIAELPIDEDGWTTEISCVSDMRRPFGSASASLVIDEIGEGEDIVCTVINTYEDDDGGDDDGSSGRRRTTATTQPKLDTPCYDGEALNEAGVCVTPERPSEDEVVVLGVQIEATTTTVDAVTTDTLPFTGDDSTQLLIVGLLMLIAGALILGGSIIETSWIRGGRYEAPRRTIRRWENQLS